MNEYEWDDDWERGEEDEEENAEGAAPVFTCKLAVLGGWRRLDQVGADAVEIGRLQGFGDFRRERFGDGLLCLHRTGGLLHGAKEHCIAAALGQAGNEVKCGINDAPREVAADGADKHSEDIFLSRLRHADGTGEGEHHNEAEDDLRKAFEWIEDAGAIGLAAHGFAAGSRSNLSMASASVVKRSMRPTLSSTPSTRSMSRTVERASTSRNAMPRFSISACNFRNMRAPAMSTFGAVEKS